MLAATALVPVLAWIALNAAAGLLLTIPPQRRPLFLPALLLPATISFTTIHYMSSGAELWGLFTMISFIHYTSLLYIKKWSIRTSQESGKATRLTQTWLSIDAVTTFDRIVRNPRFVRVPYQYVAGTPVRSTAFPRRFSWWRVLRLLVGSTLVFLMNQPGFLGHFVSFSVVDFEPQKSDFLLRLLLPGRYGPSVFAREVALRIWFSLTTLWTPIEILDGIHAGLAIFFLYIVRIDTRDDWPDLFGSPSEAFTLGRFWSRFWHRIHVNGYNDYINLVLPRFVARNPALKKIFTTILMFLISGIIHQVTAWKLDPVCGNSNWADMKFFAINAAAVCWESTVFQLVARLRQERTKGTNLRTTGRTKESKEDKQQVRPGRLLRLLGYVWVMSFFVWVLPKCYYQRVYCMLRP